MIFRTYWKKKNTPSACATMIEGYMAITTRRPAINMQKSIVEILKGNIVPFWVMKMFSCAVFAHHAINI